MSRYVFRKAYLPPMDETEKLSEANADLEEPSITETKRRIEQEKDKRREDWSNTTKWGISVTIALTAIVMALIGALAYQVHSFNGELRDMRDRLTIIETERRIEKAHDRNE